MLFELSITKKYLIPKKLQLSRSLIALMSVGVISLVVWLILVFLSVTDGIEKNWLKKLTSLNAPIQITPTDAYYNSYYYQIDRVSASSNYTLKNIREKIEAPQSDPYLPEEDLEIPAYWPDKLTDSDGSLKDLAKLAFQSIDHLKLGSKPLIAQDYEVSGALLKLQMVRPQDGSFIQNYLTQVSYISSFSGDNPFLHSLIEEPRIDDLNHLFSLAELSHQSAAADKPERIVHAHTAEFQKKLLPLLKNVTFKKMRSKGQKLAHLLQLLPEGVCFDVFSYSKRGAISYFVFSNKGEKQPACFDKGTIMRQGDKLLFTPKKGVPVETGLMTPLYTSKPISMEASLRPYEIDKIRSLRDLAFDVSFELQGRCLKGVLPWEGLEIEEADVHTSFEQTPSTPPPWVYKVNGQAVLPAAHHGAAGVLLPKNYQTSGVQIGDGGYFSYNAATASSMQEQRLTLYVAGFYDPGAMAIGARMALTVPEVVHAINSSSQTHSFDRNMVNGIQVWFDDLNQTGAIQAKLKEAFDEAGILPFWKITPFYEYDFAKDLLQQFQSDKYLFTLIAIIVLIVACSNIISLLIILVNDKKREIAILSAMGASKKTIAGIFTLCGGIIGCASTLIGISVALLTIHNIDSVVHFLSLLQGHDAFNTVFYGKSLPNELSERAVAFILIATPIISLLAGLVPALKACKVHPSIVLRSD